MELVKVRNLKKYFKIKKGIFKERVIKAVDDVSFDVDKGSTVSLIGESGSGKTTLALTMLKLIDPTGGEVYFDGVDIFKLKGKMLKHVRREMGIVFQDPYLSLNPTKRVRDILELPLKIHMPELRKDERRSKIIEMLEIVGLKTTDADRYPHEFSGGQRQRIAIARAIITKPKFIILDEPTSALDLSVQATILNLLMDLQKTLKLTYLLITHDMSIVKHISDYINVMYLGRIIESAPAEEFFEEPLHPYSKALLSAVPTLSKKNRRNRILLKGSPPDPANLPPGCRFSNRCPYAMGKCMIEEPLMISLNPTRKVACHLYT